MDVSVIYCVLVLLLGTMPPCAARPIEKPAPQNKKQLPDDPLNIARQCNYGQDQLAKVNYLAEEDHNKADQETGRPAFYDNAIPTEYEHSIGIRKDPMK